MPILKENQYRYPPNWDDIRAAMLDRAGHRCERCKVPNHVFGYRDIEGHFQIVNLKRQYRLYAAPNLLPQLIQESFFVRRLFQIVLTVAHLNHQPEDCRPENLQVLCQQCHLRHDVYHHAATRVKQKYIMLERVGQIRMFY